MALAHRRHARGSNASSRSARLAPTSSDCLDACGEVKLAVLADARGPDQVLAVDPAQQFGIGIPAVEAYVARTDADFEDLLDWARHSAAGSHQANTSSKNSPNGANTDPAAVVIAVKVGTFSVRSSPRQKASADRLCQPGRISWMAALGEKREAVEDDGGRRKRYPENRWVPFSQSGVTLLCYPVTQHGPPIAASRVPASPPCGNRRCQARALVNSPTHTPNRSRARVAPGL